MHIVLRILFRYIVSVQYKVYVHNKPNNSGRKHIFRLQNCIYPYIYIYLKQDICTNIVYGNRYRQAIIIFSFLVKQLGYYLFSRIYVPLMVETNIYHFSLLHLQLSCTFQILIFHELGMSFSTMQCFQLVETLVWKTAVEMNLNLPWMEIFMTLKLAISNQLYDFGT